MVIRQSYGLLRKALTNVGILIGRIEKNDWRSPSRHLGLSIDATAFGEFAEKRAILWRAFPIDENTGDDRKS
jgi:hypothetical protein